MPTIYVIGIGYRPLDQKARTALLKSHVVLASGRLMEVFPSYPEHDLVKDRIRIINNVDEVMDFMAASLAADPNVVIGLIASGDPMFHGIGKRTLDRFGSEVVEILPDLSCVQLASAAIKESWDDALLVSLHGGPNPAKRRKLPYLPGDLPHLLMRHRKLFILTDRENTPSRIADILAACKGMTIAMHVCEQLGYPSERVISGSPAELAGKVYREPNIVAACCVGSPAPVPVPVFGLKEAEIAHSRGLITKDEIRAVVLHKLSLPSSGIVWDIGAGSGSVSLEIARLAAGLAIYAIEKDDEQIAHIRANRAAFGATNIEPVRGTAPEALATLPAPDRVFIGGSGGRLPQILDAVSSRMVAGIIVTAAVQIESLAAARDALAARGYEVESGQISVARLAPIADGARFVPQNPVFIIKGERHA
ncbi:MAG TPA: precorrin-6y C5,15-methyltransferase (decarboxylating) subunit CbiE [Dissulfurispiraceae bacterium]|nr:precorrin-6y C5,15-methyltransferase (decarboxylating) subunit CbiE [Dissulfurispiraceae bacterium]